MWEQDSETGRKPYTKDLGHFIVLDWLQASISFAGGWS